MTCPIGLPGIDGKEPEVIAAAVVAQLLLVSGPAADGADRGERHAACPSSETLQASEINSGNHRRDESAATGRGEGQDGFETAGRATASRSAAAPLVAAGHRDE